MLIATFVLLGIALIITIVELCYVLRDANYFRNISLAIVVAILFLAMGFLIM